MKRKLHRSDKDANILREAAALLAWCRGCAVLLPPLAQKYNLDGAFDEAAGAMADIFKHQGIMCYRPSGWQKLQLFEQPYPLGTTTNRRIITRVFQLLMRIAEFYASVRDKYCAAKVLQQSATGDITSMLRNGGPMACSSPLCAVRIRELEPADR